MIPASKVYNTYPLLKLEGVLLRIPFLPYTLAPQVFNSLFLEGLLWAKQLLLHNSPQVLNHLVSKSWGLYSFVYLLSFQPQDSIKSITIEPFITALNYPVQKVSERFIYSKSDLCPLVVNIQSLLFAQFH